jgi:hypothetical protein
MGGGDSMRAPDVLPCAGILSSLECNEFQFASFISRIFDGLPTPSSSSNEEKHQSICNCNSCVRYFWHHGDSDFSNGSLMCYDLFSPQVALDKEEGFVKHIFGKEILGGAQAPRKRPKSG